MTQDSIEQLQHALKVRAIKQFVGIHSVLNMFLSPETMSCGRGVISITSGHFELFEKDVRDYTLHEIVKLPSGFYKDRSLPDSYQFLYQIAGFTVFRNALSDPEYPTVYIDHNDNIPKWRAVYHTPEVIGLGQRLEKELLEISLR